jgi:hypothetical protein
MSKLQELDVSGGGNDAFNPKSPLEARMARRRLSVVRGTTDANVIERAIDGAGNGTFFPFSVTTDESSLSVFMSG